MWQFAEAVRGLADGCQELGIPVTGGNVSFYNQTGAAAIHPTPVVGVLGVLDDVAGRVPMGFPPPTGDGDLLFLLGETRVRAVRLRVGLGDPRPPRRPAAEGRPGRASRRSAALLAEAARARAPQRGARPLRRRSRPGAGRVAACAATSARGSRCRSDRRSRRSSTCSASRPAGRWSRCRAGTTRRSSAWPPSTASRARRSA